MSKIRMMAECDISKALSLVKDKIKLATTSDRDIPRLVAVSKTKPLQSIYAAYAAGQRHFGENYIQELEEKSKNDELLTRCSEIKWHYIGRLQSNKVKNLLKVPNLYMVETISSRKLAKAVDAFWEKLEKDEPLRVMLQVNTSSEEQKGGCTPAELPEFVTYVRHECKHLNFTGLMTIGSFGYDLANGPNPDFLCLRDCRSAVCSAVGLDVEDVELSMGMSNDYEHAIELGSTNVRVGSTIFGAREYKPKATPSDPQESPS